MAAAQAPTKQSDVWQAVYSAATDSVSLVTTEGPPATTTYVDDALGNSTSGRIDKFGQATIPLDAGLGAGASVEVRYWFGGERFTMPIRPGAIASSIIELNADGRRALVGTVEPDAIVHLDDDALLSNGTLVSVRADEHGRFAALLGTLHVDNDSVVAYQGDSGVRASVSIRPRPVTARIGLVSGGTQCVLSGTGESGAHITATIDDEVLPDETVVSAGRWSIPLACDLGPGRHDGKIEQSLEGAPAGSLGL